MGIEPRSWISKLVKSGETITVTLLTIVEGCLCCDVRDLSLNPSMPEVTNEWKRTERKKLSSLTMRPTGLSP